MIFTAVITLAFCIAVTACYFEFRRLTRLRTSVAEGSARLVHLERQVTNYRERVAFYGTDEGMAHLARERFNLVLPGERVFIINREGP